MSLGDLDSHPLIKFIYTAANIPKGQYLPNQIMTEIMIETTVFKIYIYICEVINTYMIVMPLPFEKHEFLFVIQVFKWGPSENISF